MLGLLALAACACNLNNPGVSPPKGQLAYPIALALSDTSGKAAPKYLYVANSNFDIAYNAGSVQSYDLAKIDTAIETNDCLSVGLAPATADREDGGTIVVQADAGVDGGVELPAGYENASEYGTPRGVLCDGLDPAANTKCCFPENAKFLKSEVEIDSYATGIALRADGKRLYVPVRSRNRLLYVTVTDGALSCGSSGRCERGPDRGSSDEAPFATFAPQPNSLVVGNLADVVDPVQAKAAKYSTAGTYITTVHETGEVSLFVERGGKAPELQDVYTGSAPRATSVTRDPVNGLFYVTASTASFVDRVGVRIATMGVQGKAAPRELLEASTPLFLSGFPAQAATDLRDVEVDPSDPTRVFALIRGFQQSVAFLQLDSSTTNEARLIGSTRVGNGPSKITVTSFDGRQLLLVSCYDARAIFVIDAETRQVIEIIRGLSGPFELVVDPVRKFLYVADFRASVLRVVDARGLVDRTLPPPRIIATLGDPTYAGGL